MKIAHEIEVESYGKIENLPIEVIELDLNIGPQILSDFTYNLILVIVKLFME